MCAEFYDMYFIARIEQFALKFADQILDLFRGISNRGPCQSHERHCSRERSSVYNLWDKDYSRYIECIKV